MRNVRPHWWGIVLATSVAVLSGVLVLQAAASTSAVTRARPAAKVHARVSSAPRRSVTFNGTVRAVVVSGDRIYVGGDFSRARTAAGTVSRLHAAALNARTGKLLGWNPKVNGPVLAIATRGDDVYLGGTFHRVGAASRRNLAEVSAAGKVLRGFARGPNRAVSAMAISGQSLFIGGKFGSVGGNDHNRLAAYNLKRRTVRRTWSPSATGQVRALAVGQGRLYVGGSFHRVNGRSGTKFLAAVGLSKGHVDPSFHPSLSYRVNDLAVTQHGVIAAADGPGGNLRSFRLDGRDRWDLHTDGGVQAVTVVGRRIYLGGHFGRVCPVATAPTRPCPNNRPTRHKLAAVTVRGNLLHWNPDANSRLGVVAMDFAAKPTRLAVGGDFTTMGRADRTFFALFG